MFDEPATTTKNKHEQGTRRKKIQALEHPNMQHMQHMQHIDTPQIDTLQYIQCVQHNIQTRTYINLSRNSCSDVSNNVANLAMVTVV